MSVLWTWEELGALFVARQTSPQQHRRGIVAPSISGVSIDSRTTQPGDLFIALSGDPGPRFSAPVTGQGRAAAGQGRAAVRSRDGHDFVSAAVSAGATVVMIHRHPDDKAALECPRLEVKDTLDGLWQLGRAARHRNHGQIIAITGSGGKTTLRLWLASILTSLGRTHASVQSLNNHWGVPLSLARMPTDARYGVFEIGTSHAGEIQPLVQLVAPDVAVLLNVLPAHLGNFANMQALTEEKLSIATGLGSNGCLVMPFQLAGAVAHQGSGQGYRTITFGTHEDADVSGSMTPVSGGAQITARVMGQIIELTIPFVGEERLESALAVLATLHALGIRLVDTLPLFKTLMLPEGRGQRIRAGSVTLIDDSYNANPVSMKMAISALLRDEEPGRKIALLGEMLELGDATVAAHIEIGNSCAGLDRVITFGDGFKGIKVRAVTGNATGPDEHYSSVDEFDLPEFARSLQPGDQILIKGSNKVFWVRGFVEKLRVLAGETQP